MKLFFYTLLVAVAATGTCYAGSSFLDFLNSPGTNQPQHQYHQGQGIVCQNCGFNNQPGAAYCAGCGRQLQSGDAVYVTCPHCGRNNTIEAKYCPSCGVKNPINGNFCLKCGKNIAMPKYVVTCQFCGDQFSFTTNTTQETYRCRNCNRYYDAGLDECPYCSEYRDGRRHRDRDRDDDRDGHRDGDKDRDDDHKKGDRSPSGTVLVDQFTKTSSGQQGKKYDISGHTGSRAFSKVIVDCNIKSGGISINTIYVKKGSQEFKHPVTARLQNGKNEFSIDLPQGTNFLTISFQSSGEIDVKVYIR